AEFRRSPHSPLDASLASAEAGQLGGVGGPVDPARTGSPEIVSPFFSAGLKNVKATPCWPLPSTLSANFFVSLMSAWAPESAFTPMAISGGSNEAWVTQLTAAAATRPSGWAAVSTYMP